MPGSSERIVHYRVFVDTETERRYREQMGDLDEQIKAFFAAGVQGRIDLAIAEASGNCIQEEF
jgi:hypothetical protein